MMLIDGVTYLIIPISIMLVMFKINKYGFNLLRFNFLVFIFISLIPFCVMYDEYLRGELTNYFALRIFFTLSFILLIISDNTRINSGHVFPVDIQLVYTIGITSTIISITYITIIGPKNFPLFNLFGSSYQDLILMREDSYKLADIPIILSYMVFYNKYFLIPLFSATLPVFRRILSKKFVLFVVAIMIINQLLTLSKTALFLMALAPLITSLYLYGISARKISVAALVILCVPLAILYVLQSDRDFWATSLAILNRLFLIPEFSALEYYSLYRDGEFKSVTSSVIFTLFNQQEVANIQNIVFLKTNPDALLQEGTTPGNIFGMPFVDMWEALIGLYYLLILLFMYWLNRFLLEYKSRLTTAFQVSASIGLSFIYFTNFPTALNSYGVILLIVLGFFVKKYPKGIKV